MIMEIRNDGPLVASSNYWESQLAADGMLYLTVNAGAFRLLLPRTFEESLGEMATAKEVVVIRGPAPRIKRADAISIVFDDRTDNPYQLDLSLEQVDRLPTPEDVTGAWEFTAWTGPRRGVPHQALRRPARYQDAR